MANILIIDDDGIYGDMTRQRLERAGHQVAVHVGPFGATAAVQAAHLDLVLLDVFMPGLSGPELLALIRKNAAKPDLRIMLFSSMDKAALGRLAQEHHVAGFVHKSAGREEFLAAVERAVTP